MVGLGSSRDVPRAQGDAGEGEGEPTAAPLSCVERPDPSVREKLFMITVVRKKKRKRHCFYHSPVLMNLVRVSVV